MLTATGRQPVTFSNFETFQFNNASAVGSFPAPDTSDRGALTGLDAQHRFVQVLYLDDLGRPGSASELQMWVNLLNGPGGSQAAVANGVAHSFEARDHVVKSWYATYLGRPAQGGEEVGWASLLQSNTEEQVLSAILSDPGHEFYNRAQTLVASGTADQRFVQALYQVLLDRPADANETAGWVGQLPQGGLAGVALGIVQSEEYRLDTVAQDYVVLVRRSASPAELFALAFSNVDTATLRIDLESSAEFFANG
jgi:hypothetical protein